MHVSTPGSAGPRDVLPTAPAWLTRTTGAWLGSIVRKVVVGSLVNLPEGRLTIKEGGSSQSFGPGSEAEAVVIEVLDARFWTEVFGAGTNGAGEAYRQGWWRADDLTGLIRLFARNRDTANDLESGWARLAAPLRAAALRANRNTVAGSRRNIEAHYDLSNEFFALILDSTMSYSCGIYPTPQASLEEASIEKIDRLCRKLQLREGDRLLEIGTGWGSLAIHAARHYGASVVTTTISREQAAWAERRIAEEGLASRIDLRRCDYRDLDGTFDKLVSVEMIEAVGADFYEDFFQVLEARLADDGIAAIQAITIADQYFAEARDTEDFIKKFIFPGSCIPSISALLAASTAASDLKLVQLEDITQHYCRTLAAWRENLLSRRDEVLALGLSDEFLRTWDFYFSYCEGGFAERHIGDVQMLFARPGWRGAVDDFGAKSD